MITKDFEKYFPLPMTFDEKNNVIEASNGITLAYTSKYLVQVGQARNALKRTWRYAVQCANLMPEAVELLGKCVSELQRRCDYCAGKDGRACIGCSNSETRAEIDALLAKLEGGETALLQRIIANRFYIEDYGKIKPEDNFKNDLMADWLDMIELIEDVEYEFDIHISDTDIDSIQTVKDLMECIERAKGGADDENN